MMIVAVEETGRQWNGKEVVQGVNNYRITYLSNSRIICYKCSTCIFMHLIGDIECRANVLLLLIIRIFRIYRDFVTCTHAPPLISDAHIYCMKLSDNMCFAIRMIKGGCGAFP